MENKFYVGDVFHSRRFIKASCLEKLVLYKENDFSYLDLVGGIYYGISKENKDYVIIETLYPIDINEYKTDYLYLLNSHKNNNVKKKIRSTRKN